MYILTLHNILLRYEGERVELLLTYIVRARVMGTNT